MSTDICNKVSGTPPSLKRVSVLQEHLRGHQKVIWTKNLLSERFGSHAANARRNLSLFTQILTNLETPKVVRKQECKCKPQKNANASPGQEAAEQTPSALSCFIHSSSLGFPQLLYFSQVGNISWQETRTRGSQGEQELILQTNTLCPEL